MQKLKFFISLTNLDLILLICIGVITLFLIFLSSGFYLNDSKHKIIIEKRKKFYTEIDDGVYYFLPFLYKKVGSYFKGKKEHLLKYKKFYFYLNYEIYDFKKFHYGVGPLKQYFEKNCDKNFEDIKKDFYESGAVLFEIKKTENSK